MAVLPIRMSARLSARYFARLMRWMCWERSRVDIVECSGVDIEGRSRADIVVCSRVDIERRLGLTYLNVPELI